MLPKCAAPPLAGMPRAVGEPLAEPGCAARSAAEGRAGWMGGRPGWGGGAPGPPACAAVQSTGNRLIALSHNHTTAILQAHVFMLAGSSYPQQHTRGLAGAAEREQLQQSLVLLIKYS
jgi:hypothetical protein